MNQRGVSHLGFTALGLLAAALAGGCTGEILGGGAGPTPGAGAAATAGAGSATSGNGQGASGMAGSAGLPPEVTPTAEQCETDLPFLAPSLIRRLTRVEYNNTVRDLLGDSRNLADTFTPENRNNGFDNQAASQNVQRDDILLWEAAAGQLAQAALVDPGKFLECDVAKLGIDACFEQALPHFGGRLFRHPLAATDLTRYQEFYKARRAAGASGERATELAVSAMLMSPNFLYLVEPALDGQLRALDSFEVATRLSYLLWKSAPDAELNRAAEASELAAPDGVSRQAARLLAHANTGRAVLDFYFQWADGPGIDGLVIPDGFAESLKAAAQNEVASFVGAWFNGGSGLIPELFTSRAAKVDAELARFYGLSAQQTGQVELPAAQRAGLLTRAVFVGTHGPPPTRGDFVLNRVLCSPVPPPPVVPPDPTTLGKFNTRREMFEAHAGLACAKGCHTILDPVGFPFEHYDDSGRYRTEDNGFPINAATVLQVPGADDLNGSVADAIELSSKIAASQRLLSCQSEHWFRYAYSQLPAPVDQCSLATLTRALTDSQGDVRSLLLALTQTDAFRFVRKETP